MKDQSAECGIVTNFRAAADATTFRGFYWQYSKYFDKIEVGDKVCRV